MSQTGLVLRSAGYKVSDEQANQIAIKSGLKCDASEPMILESVCGVASALPKECQAAVHFADAFAPMDKTKDGTINCTDLKMVFDNMGGLKEDEKEMLIELLDPDDAGKVFINTVLEALSSKIV